MDGRSGPNPVFKIFAVDLESHREQTFAAEGHPPYQFPKGLEFVHTMRFHKSFEVRSNVLHFIDGDLWRQIELFGAGRAAQPIPDPPSAIFQVKGRLYLSGSNTVYEIKDNKNLQLLGSARRRPAASLIDELPTLNFPFLMEGPGGVLRAIIDGASYTWNGNIWSQEFELKDEYCAGAAEAVFFQTPVLLQKRPAFVQLHSLLSSETSPRYLAAAVVPYQDPKLMEGETNEWILSFYQLKFGAPTVVGQKPALYVVADPPKAIQPHLLVFGPAGSSLTDIPLRFSAYEAEMTDFTLGPGVWRPWALNAPGGLILGNRTFAGFCFVPNEAIEKALATASAVSAADSSTPISKLP